MPTMIIDIETIGAVPPEAQAAVEKLARGRDWTVDRYAALCPPLARVVCAAVLEHPGGGLAVYCDSTLAPAPLPPVIPVPRGDGQGYVDAVIVSCEGEAGLLETLGKRLARHLREREARIVTYNGRGFDLPVLLHRSIALGVTTGRSALEDLLGENRFRPQRHVDLMELVSQFGATPRWPLAAYAIGYGHRSPKADMDGSEVGPAIAAGRLAAVAEYCAGDVLATAHVLARFEGSDPA